MLQKSVKNMQYECSIESLLLEQIEMFLTFMYIILLNEIWKNTLLADLYYLEHPRIGQLWKIYLQNLSIL